METCLTEQWLRNNGVSEVSYLVCLSRLPLAHTYVYLSSDGNGKISTTTEDINRVKVNDPDAFWFICANKDISDYVLSIMVNLSQTLNEVQT